MDDRVLGFFYGVCAASTTTAMIDGFNLPSVVAFGVFSFFTMLLMFLVIIDDSEKLFGIWTAIFVATLFSSIFAFLNIHTFGIYIVLAVIALITTISMATWEIVRWAST